MSLISLFLSFSLVTVSAVVLSGEEEEDDDEDGRPRTAAPGAVAAAKAKKGVATGEQEHKESNWKDQSAGLREAMRRAKLEKAKFGQSNAMGIDMSKMMMR